MNPVIYYSKNIDKLTAQNDNYRVVLFSHEDSQLTLQTLNPGEDIPFEKHENTKQSFKFVKGKGEVIIYDEFSEEKIYYPVSEDSYVIVPSKTWHYVRNTSQTEPLRLYADYSKPVHDPRETLVRQSTIFKLKKSKYLYKTKNVWVFANEKNNTLEVDCPHSFDDLSEISLTGKCNLCEE